MKIRSVRPEFFTDSKMPLLSPAARLLYVGLWCYADDEGRGEYLPKLIEGSVFPHEQVDILALLTELIRLKRIVTYEADGQQYFHIPPFEDYQKPNRRYASRLPPPPSHTRRAGGAQDASNAGVHAGAGEGEGDVEAAGEGGVEGEEAAEFNDLCITLAEELADARTADGYQTKNRRAFVAHLAQSPEVRNQALKRMPAATNVRDLLAGIGRHMEGTG